LAHLTGGEISADSFEGEDNKFFRKRHRQFLSCETSFLFCSPIMRCQLLSIEYCELWKRTSLFFGILPQFGRSPI
jgi:hypothetical protein